MARVSDAINNTSALDEAQFILIYSISFWWNIIIIPVGIAGSILCLLVVSQKQNRSISCSVYMGALAVFDTLVLICKSLQLYVVYGTSNVNLAMNIISCRAIGFMFFTSSQCGSMTILAMLLERVIAVTKPLKAAVLLSPKRALIISLMIPTVLSIFNIPHMFSYTSRLIMRQMECVVLDGAMITTRIYSMLTLFISGILPLFGILIMNLIILCAVKSAKFSWITRINRHSPKNSKRLSSSKERTHFARLAASTSGNVTDTTMSSLSSLPSTLGDSREIDISTIEISGHQHASTGTRSPSTDEPDFKVNPSTDNREKHLITDERNKKRESVMNKRDRQLTVMTVVMTLTFLVCVPPYYARSLVYLLLDSPTYEQVMLIRAWMSTVFTNLMTRNSAINFFLYVMTGSKFRADLMRILMFHLRCATE